jgi:hypothetical protein
MTPLHPDWAARIDGLRAEVEQMEFRVLVWGPGDNSHTPYRAKRLVLREHLAAVVGEGRVLFSEDPDLAELRAKEGDFGAELLQVQAADAVVLIPESMGSVTEAALYGNELAGKTIVFTQQRAGGGGFARTGYEHLKVVEVADEEWATCNRIRQEAQRFVQQMRYRKYQQESRS